MSKTKAAVIAIVAIMVASALDNGLLARSNWDENARANKADYIFLQALAKRDAKNGSAYYDLLKYASESNPGDKYIKMLTSMVDFYLTKSKESHQQQINDILDYCLENPDDYHAIVTYLNLAYSTNELDNVDSVWAMTLKHHPDRPELRLSYARSLTVKGDSAGFQKALEVLDQYERTEGIDSELQSARMEIYSAMGDTMQVIEEGRRLLAKSPHEARFNTFFGELLHNYNYNDSALIYFSKAIDIDPDSGEPYYYRAKLYDEMGDSLKYEEEVTKAVLQTDLELPNKLAILHRFIAKVYDDSLYRPKLNDIFRQLIEKTPHEPAIRAVYSDYLISQADLAGAAEQLSYKLDINPDDRNGWEQLCRLYWACDQFDKALAAADNGIHYFPEDVSLMLLASALALEKDKDQLALDYADKALAAADTTNMIVMSNIYQHIGDVYYNISETEKSFDYYKKAVKANPRNSMALNNYAYYMSCHDMDLDEALRMIDRALLDKPESDTFLDTKAWVLFKRKDYIGAKEVIDKCLEISTEESAEMLDHAGDIYFMNGEPGDALEFWEKALKLDPDNDLLKRKVKYKTFFYE